MHLRLRRTRIYRRDVVSAPPPPAQLLRRAAIMQVRAVPVTEPASSSHIEKEQKELSACELTEFP